MNVTLTPKEQKAFQDFVDKLPEKKLKSKPVKLYFVGGAGIGVCVFAKCGKHKADITDYESW